MEEYNIIELQNKLETLLNEQCIGKNTYPEIIGALEIIKAKVLCDYYASHSDEEFEECNYIKEE